MIFNFSTYNSNFIENSFSDLAGLDVNEINMGQKNELRIKQTTASYSKLKV